MLSSLQRAPEGNPQYRPSGYLHNANRLFSPSGKRRRGPPGISVRSQPSQRIARVDPRQAFGPCCPGRLIRGLPAVASRARWSTRPTASQNAFLRCHPGPVPASIRQRSRGHAWRRSAGRSTGRIPLPPARTGGSVSLPDTISPTFPYIKMRQGFRRQLQLRIPRNSHLDSR